MTTQRDDSWRRMPTPWLEHKLAQTDDSTDLYEDIEDELDRRSETDDRVRQANGSYRGGPS